MSYLELLRVFPLDFDTLTLPYWSWERWIAAFLLAAIYYATYRTFHPWLKALRVTAKILGGGAARVTPEHFQNFMVCSMGTITGIATLAGGLYCVAGLINHESLEFYRDHGLMNFSELDVAGWLYLASMALMAWLVVVVLCAGIGHCGPVIGLIGLIPWLAYAGGAFLMGALAGPVALFFILRPANLSAENTGHYLYFYFCYPFQLITSFAPWRWRSPASVYRDAMNRASRL